MPTKKERVAHLEELRRQAAEGKKTVHLDPAITSPTMSVQQVVPALPPVEDDLELADEELEDALEEDDALASVPSKPVKHKEPKMIRFNVSTNITQIARGQEVYAVQTDDDGRYVMLPPKQAWYAHYVSSGILKQELPK